MSDLTRSFVKRFAVSRTRLNAILDELDAFLFCCAWTVVHTSVTIYTDHVRREHTVGYFKIAFYWRESKKINKNIRLNEGQKPFIYEDAPLETSHHRLPVPNETQTQYFGQAIFQNRQSLLNRLTSYLISSNPFRPYRLFPVVFYSTSKIYFTPCNECISQALSGL